MEFNPGFLAPKIFISKIDVIKILKIILKVWTEFKCSLINVDIIVQKEHASIGHIKLYWKKMAGW